MMQETEKKKENGRRKSASENLARRQKERALAVVRLGVTALVKPTIWHRKNNGH